MQFPEIPLSWLIGIIAVGLVILRFLNLDTWVTASLSLIIGYLTGKHIEETKQLGQEQNQKGSFAGK